MLNYSQLPTEEQQRQATERNDAEEKMATVDHLWERGPYGPIIDGECLCAKCCAIDKTDKWTNFYRTGQLQRLRDERPSWASVTFRASQVDRALNLIAEYCYSVRAIRFQTSDGQSESGWSLLVELRRG